jgi:hypothetical protein
MTILALAALGAIGVGVYVGANRYLDDRRASETARLIAAAEAEADKLDPGWRFDDIEKAREQIPDDRNSALIVLKAHQHIPKEWHNATLVKGPDGRDTFLDNRLREASPCGLPSATVRKELKDHIENAGPALTEALKLVDLPKGRYPVDWKLNPQKILLPHQDARLVGHLLALEASRRAYDGDIPGALVACRATLNAARSVGDEPLVIPQLVRTGVDYIAVETAERVLGQGQVGDDNLVVLQRCFEEESAEPLLLIGMRGERALQHRFMFAILDGRTTIDGSEITPAERRGELREMRPTAPQLLELTTLAVEAAKGKPDDWKAAFAKVDRHSDGMKPYAALMSPTWTKFAVSQQRRVASLSCAAVAVAVERYRIAKGGWPETLEQVVKAGLLKAVPRDPFDARPLRMIKRNGGVVVYSVGQDETDDGGNLDRLRMTEPGVDIGFELFAPDRRKRK